MATSFCPACGAEYVATARICPACGVLLDDSDTVVYEMDGWEPAERADLDQILDAAAVPHRWQDDDLVVPGADEAKVDALMDTVEYPDALEAEEDDDIDDEAAYRVMSDLFVAADQMAAERVVDVELAGDLVTASAAASSAPPPYGVDSHAWTQVQQLAEGIVAAIEVEADDEVVAREAASLRDLLRRFV